MTSRTRPRRNSIGERAGLGSVAARGRRDNQIKFFTIAEVAERLCVATRTVRRWVEAGDLAVHRGIREMVRIADDDLRAFLALHRKAEQVQQSRRLSVKVNRMSTFGNTLTPYMQIVL